MKGMEQGGWDYSAEAWIESMGEDGDWSRRHVLDPAISAIFEAEPRGRVLDVGCGEGRFCRRLKAMGFEVTGIDPTIGLLDRARLLDPSSEYRLGTAEDMPFEDGAFDAALAYLSLLDIPDFRAAISEMNRVVRSGGMLVVANIGNHASTSAEGWVRDDAGNKLYYPVDNYMDEFGMWVAWRGIRVLNYHRPLSAYMDAFLSLGLRLERYLEPDPVGVSEEEVRQYRRVPWFSVMVWRKS